MHSLKSSMKSLLQNSLLMVLLAAALLLSPVQAHAETFRGVVIDVDKEQGRMSVAPEQGTSDLPSPVLVQFSTDIPPSGQCRRVQLQCICKGKTMSITGTFSTKQPELFIATTVLPTNKAHFKDRTGVRLRLGRCRQSGKSHGTETSF